MSKRFLLDVNVLVALTSREHEHYRRANDWFNSLGKAEWGVTPLTEAGYMRLTTNPRTSPGAGDFTRAIAVLVHLTRKPGYCIWPNTESWAKLTAPFADRIFGHQQVTDAYLLGLAINENGVLVTFDRGLRYMAGAEFRKNILVLE